MRTRNLVELGFLFISSVILWGAAATQSPKTHPGHSGEMRLAEGWELQSSAKVEQKGEVISTARFQPKGWYSVTVPTTVVAAMVKLKVYPDPMYGMNLRQLPGVSYPVGGNFSNLAMPADSPFAVPWWYRKEFTIPASDKGKTLWLNFRGLNYRANVWLNGKQIANSNDVAGAGGTDEFHITAVVKAGTANVLAVEVFAPTETDLAITFVDWNPQPPDKNMGLWREVYLATSGPVAVRHPSVFTKLDSPDNTNAHLTVAAVLTNASKTPVTGVLRGKIEATSFEQQVELAG